MQRFMQEVAPKLRDLVPTREPEAVPATSRVDLDRYAQLFNARDWDGLRELISADARLLVADRYAGPFADGGYLGVYSRMRVTWRLTLGEMDGEPAIVLLNLRDGSWLHLGRQLLVGQVAHGPGHPEVDLRLRQGAGKVPAGGAAPRSPVAVAVPGFLWTVKLPVGWLLSTPHLSYTGANERVRDVTDRPRRRSWPGLGRTRPPRHSAARPGACIGRGDCGR